MNLKQAKHIHFVGIKGVGMTATALCCQDLGIQVTGSDLDEDFVTQDVLEQRHISITAGFSPETLPNSADFVVFTGAHRGPANPQVKHAQSLKIPTITQAEAVGHLMTDKIGISVCGVGGKSTTSAMIASILDSANLSPSFLVGVGNINNLGIPGRYVKTSLHFVAEADEYATAPGVDSTPKFLHQKPEIIVCTNIALDHPDIYSSLSAVQQAYRKFFETLNPTGILIANGDDPNILPLLSDLSCQVLTFGHQSHNDYQLVSTTHSPENQHVTIQKSDQSFSFDLQVPGTYNALNALSAFAVADQQKVDHHLIKSGLASFTSTLRRFQKIATHQGINYYDDYAHHPSEIKAVLQAAKSFLPNTRLIVIFQPHTYSRTKALFDEFAHAFTDADELIIAPIYPSAREDPDPTITSKLLAERISEFHTHVQHLDSISNIVKYLKNHAKPDDTVITLGAGDIYKLHNYI